MRTGGVPFHGPQSRFWSPVSGVAGAVGCRSGLGRDARLLCHQRTTPLSGLHLLVRWPAMGLRRLAALWLGRDDYRARSPLLGFRGDYPDRLRRDRVAVSTGRYSGADQYQRALSVTFTSASPATKRRTLSVMTFRRRSSVCGP